MNDYCENPYCENEATKKVDVSEDRPGDSSRRLCGACEEVFTWGVQHGTMTAGQTHERSSRRALAILKEFVADIDAVGARVVARQWPDLVVTWRKARTLLRETYETLRDAGVAILENQPYPPDNAAPAAVRAAAPAEAALDAETVIVGVYGGLVQWVQKGDPKIRVIVRDYDTDGCDEQERAGLHRDADGQYYNEWEG